jgi:hypothetical protein
MGIPLSSPQKPVIDHFLNDRRLSVLLELTMTMQSSDPIKRTLYLKFFLDSDVGIAYIPFL